MPESRGAPASPPPALATAPDPASCPPPPRSPGPQRGSSVPQKVAEALSSQYGLNVFVAGLLFLLAWAVHAAGVGKRDLLCLLTALMLLQLLWMLWYVGRSYAERHLIRPKDAHAGARWLRGSVTLFAVITIILGCFKVGYFIGFSECLSAAEGVFPVTHAVHTLLQADFCTALGEDVNRLWKWKRMPPTPRKAGSVCCSPGRGLWPELVLRIRHGDLNLSLDRAWSLPPAGEGGQGGRMRFGVIHSVFTNLLLWANSVLNESKHQLNEHKARLITLGFGNITIDPGIQHALRALEEHRAQRGRCAAPARWAAAMAVYLVHIGRSKAKSEAALAMFYLYAIALLLLMGAAGLLGIRIYRVDEKSLDESKNPARKLDADLLVGTASGSWLLSWGSILAMACAETRPPHTWYNLPYSVLAIAEKYIQNLFIIESARREPESLPEDACTLRVLTLWIPPAFGCRPEYDNGLEEVVFGFEPWIIVVNLAMPFSVFYRMHAAASLFEVYSQQEQLRRGSPSILNWHREASDPDGGGDLPSDPANGTAWEAPGEPVATAVNCDSSLNRAYAISSSLISFYIPVAVMIVTYTRIYRIAQEQIRRIASLERAAEHAQSCRSRVGSEPDASLRSSIRKETKVLKTLSVIMGVFVCCWLPFFVLNCMAPFCHGDPEDLGAGFPCVSETTFDVFVWFGWTNSSLNPVIYAFNADFRKVFAQLLGCSHLCRRTPVETVNISNELISYNQDTVFHKEVAAAYVHMIPNAVVPGDGELEDEEEDEEDPFHRMPQICQSSPDGDPAVGSVWELDCDGEVSLGKITPLTPNGVP
ncbi:Otopetrin-1 [Fukomys damarensis]|uniref:Otopetrin-1 n=1 Tax=Fukomys damarensis TaxID=885580 RepID=A0A091D5L6_FUKDA|nr:Otopetrin-1 [Fukomys damarensis]